MMEEVFLMKQGGFSYRDIEDMPSWERKKYLDYIKGIIEKANEEMKNG